MKNLLLIIALFGLPMAAQNIAHRLDSIIAADPLTKTAQVGVMVWNLSADSALYAYQHRQLMRPASTMKVLTAVAALDILGADYRLSTSLYYKGTVEQRTLHGDLYIVGGMDPLFDTDDLDAFVTSVQRLGIDTLRGRIIADLTVKDTLRYGSGWCWDDDNYDLTPLRMGRRLDVAPLMAAALKRAGVVQSDVATTGRGRLPANATFIGARTHTIDQVLHEMLKESNNLFAESVFYQTAMSTGHRPATADDARRHERIVMQRAGLLPRLYRIADGSGLSLYNYLSAEALTMLLRYAWFDRRIFDHLFPALPVAGRDGTLSKRFVGTVAENRLCAKTGTLTGIVSLAGYVPASKDHDLCFAIIVQGVMSTAEGRRLIDRLTVAICEGE